MVNTRSKTVGAGNASTRSGTVDAAAPSAATGRATPSASVPRQSSRTRRAPARLASEPPVQRSGAPDSKQSDSDSSNDEPEGSNVESRNEQSPRAATHKRKWVKAPILRKEELLRAMGFFGGTQQTALQLALQDKALANVILKERKLSIRIFLGERRGAAFLSGRSKGDSIDGVFQDPDLYPNDEVSDENDNQRPLRRFRAANAPAHAPALAAVHNDGEEDGMDIYNPEEPSAAAGEILDNLFSDEDETARRRRGVESPNHNQLDPTIDPRLQGEPYPVFALAAENRNWSQSHGLIPGMSTVDPRLIHTAPQLVMSSWKVPLIFYNETAAPALPEDNTQEMDDEDAPEAAEDLDMFELEG